VEKHVEAVFKKLNVRSRGHLRQELGVQTPTILSLGVWTTACHKSSDRRP
jgi:hypothetical protein